MNNICKKRPSSKLSREREKPLGRSRIKARTGGGRVWLCSKTTNLNEMLSYYTALSGMDMDQGQEIE